MFRLHRRRNVHSADGGSDRKCCSKPSWRSSRTPFLVASFFPDVRSTRAPWPPSNCSIALVCFHCHRRARRYRSSRLLKHRYAGLFDRDRLHPSTTAINIHDNGGSITADTLVTVGGIGYKGNPVTPPLMPSEFLLTSPPITHAANYPDPYLGTLTHTFDTTGMPPLRPRASSRGQLGPGPAP